MKLLLVFIALVSSTAFSIDFHLEKDAVFDLCGKEIEGGCITKITLSNGEKYVVDKSYEKSFFSYRRELINKHNGKKTLKVREVLGVISYEKGHMPDPTIKQMVFKILHLTTW